MLGGCNIPAENDSKNQSKDSRLGDNDSCASFDDTRSNTSLSSGVGSSLSTDPTVGDPASDSLKAINGNAILNASDSSISSALLPTVSIVEVEKVPEKKALPQLTCRLVACHFKFFAILTIQVVFLP